MRVKIRGIRTGVAQLCAQQLDRIEAYVGARASLGQVLAYFDDAARQLVQPHGVFATRVQLDRLHCFHQNFLPDITLARPEMYQCLRMTNLLEDYVRIDSH